MIERENGKRQASSLTAEQGMTLVELLVGLVVAMVVVAAAFTVLVTTQKATTANDQVVETQQNVRIAMDLLSRDIKLAGFGMTGPVGTCATAIVPLDHTPAGADTGPDSLRLLVPIGRSMAPAWSLASAVGGVASFNQITLPAGAVADMTTEAGGSLTGAIVTIGGGATFSVTSVSGNSLNFAQIPPPAAFPVGMPVYLLQCVTYSIGTSTVACSGDAPCLLRNGVSVADGIEDIQFAYACDGCNGAVNAGVADRIIDNQGGAAGFDQADFITNNMWSASPMTPDKIRLVQVSIVARQTDPDQGLGEGRGATALSSTALQVSDHTHAQGLFTAGDFGGLNPPYTNYRRRVLTRTVETRNQRL
ncbi:MAG: PilW family protein [Nitrospirae bacterium]|nr:PilW family protein [Nitrospirota bacterium]